jgi:hypothetical protein
MKKKLDLTSKYILGIVGIVALVGIVVMLLDIAGFSEDVSGQVIKSKTIDCTDSDDWYSHPTELPGITSTVTSSGKTLSRTDFCSTSEVLVEYYCKYGSLSSMTVDCAEDDMICSGGACIPPGSRY